MHFGSPTHCVHDRASFAAEGSVVIAATVMEVDIPFKLFSTHTDYSSLGRIATF